MSLVDQKNKKINVQNSPPPPKKLIEKKILAWKSFVAVVKIFLGNHKAKNYVGLVETSENLWLNEPHNVIKVQILHPYLDRFKENVEASSEEQGEWFTKKY